MVNEPNFFQRLNTSMLFLVWGAPSQGPRSRLLANQLGIEIHFVESGLPRGKWYALPKYLIQTAKTTCLLMKHRPRVIWVQSPPLFAVLIVYIYCFLTRSGYIVDAHSAAFDGPFWTAVPAWIKRWLMRHAIVTLVTNKHFSEIVEHYDGHSFILPDIPFSFRQEIKPSLAGQFNIILINTFAPDEPLAEVLTAVSTLPDIHLYVTGKLNASQASLVSSAPANVHFTDFIPNDAYYELLSASHAIMCLTTRNHTMQRGACEALSVGKPIITSNWPLLREYFYKGTIHVDNTALDIRRAILTLVAQYADLKCNIIQLRDERQREWQEKMIILSEYIKKRLDERRN